MTPELQEFDAGLKSKAEKWARAAVEEAYAKSGVGHRQELQELKELRIREFTHSFVAGYYQAMEDFLKEDAA